ncbi:MAG: protein kinase, partial [Isosphaeraceae bacterium]
MALSTSGRTWEDASSPDALRLVRRFESDWRRARAERPARASEVLPRYLAETEGVSGAGLALIRAEMGLRWEAGERAMAAEYLQAIPGLSPEAVVALLYEEFCLREEAGERPETRRYLESHPEHAPALRRILEIHGLVGSGTSTAFVPQTTGPGFPSAGETIAGFRLVEELGRGAFARVFLAEERQLADRPVALKTSRAGSREPQALARLQHTHIVPVHSYRTDPATGLHLLCMPYFGRVTLASLLADPSAKVARGGADLLEALDRLGSQDPPPSGRAAVRATLTPKSYAQAIAWWGARMAEALEHAHGVGLLHRDVKPSNVLVTRDGLPMLLDFNLARDAVIDANDLEAAVPGGTLDYMAPEQLDELADGVSDRIDARADVYGLGVLLFESLAGARPFPTARDSLPISELLARAAERRREGPPSMREWRPDVPSALEAVVARCLAPAPSDRYASAGDLATDLQAVADDRPLRFAREPLGDRLYRWARRNRRAIATAIPLLLALGLSAVLVLRDRLERSRIRAEVVALFEAGENSESEGKFEEAAVRFDAASRLAERPDLGGIQRQVAALRQRRSATTGGGLAAVLGLEDLRGLARRRARLAQLIGRVRADAEKVSAAAEVLRFRLSGFGGDLNDASKALADVLGPFFVFDAPKWFERPDLTLLDEAGRVRLVNEVNELLFLLALSFDAAAEQAAEGRRPVEVEEARALLREARLVCDRAIEFATPRGPWLALRARVVSLGEGDRPAAGGPAPDEPTALGCFQWGALRLREGRREEAAAHFRDAVRVDPGNYWFQYDLAFAHDHPLGNPEEALRHYDNALVLKPRSPWVRFSRGRFHRSGGNWGPAAEDLQHALSDFLALPESDRPAGFEAQVRLELGLVRQALADFKGARSEYDRVVRTDPTGSYARAARLNLAKLDADQGRIRQALDAYDALLFEDSLNRQARLARSLLKLRMGDWEGADHDLTELLREAKGSSRAEWL